MTSVFWQSHIYKDIFDIKCQLKMLLILFSNTVTEVSMLEKQLKGQCFPNNSGEEMTGERTGIFKRYRRKNQSIAKDRGNRGKWDTIRMSDGRRTDKRRSAECFACTVDWQKCNLSHFKNIIGDIKSSPLVTPPPPPTWRNSTPCLHLGAKLHMIYASRVTLRLSLRLGYTGVTLTLPLCKWLQTFCLFTLDFFSWTRGPVGENNQKQNKFSTVVELW